VAGCLHRVQLTLAAATYRPRGDAESPWRHGSARAGFVGSTAVGATDVGSPGRVNCEQRSKILLVQSSGAG
jgi:hypothetical protein